jgi:hypothetical protein
VCREILPSVPPNILVLTFTTVLLEKEVLAAISNIKLFFLGIALKIFDTSVPPNFF